MIAFRRSVAVILALIFVLLLVPLLLLYRLNGTVANPEFYVNQLRRADIYNFIYDDVLPKAMDQVTAPNTNVNGPDLSLLAPLVIPAVRDTFPPAWLQTQTETSIRAVVPYMVGSTDSFSITIPLKDRVMAGTQALKKSFHSADFTDKAYSQGVVFITSTVTSNSNKLPIPIDANTVTAMVRHLMPPEWVAAQLDAAVTEVSPYFVGDKDRFTVRIDVIGRMDDVQAVVADLLKTQQTYSYLFDHNLGPMLKQNIPASLPLISGASLTGDEILLATKQALSYDWYQRQVTAVTAQTFAYIKGTQDTLKLTFTLSDRKAAIVSALSQLVDQKLEQQYNALPVATLQQAASIMANPPRNSLPAFRLPLLSYTDLKRTFNINIETIISPLLTPVIPNDLSLTGSDLGFTATNNPLATLRDEVRNGGTFTDAQLATALGPNGNKTLTDIRKTLSGGLAITQQELQNIGSSKSVDNSGPGIEQVRSMMKTVRNILAFVWIIPLLLLVAIGFLGGRRWSSRLIWAAAVLAVGAGLSLVAFGTVFSSVVQTRLDTALLQLPGQSGSMEALLSAKGATIAQNAVGSFISGLRLETVLLFVLAVGLIVFGIIWYRRPAKS